MKKIENFCVDCDLPCLGIACPNRNVPVYYCDICNSDCANYVIDGEDYCFECAQKRMQELFDELTLSEKAELLKVYIT